MRCLFLSAAILSGTFAWAQGDFSEVWSPICTIGTTAEEGCKDIRAREILDAAEPAWRAIGRVNFASRDQRSHCTGVLVADDLVLTAAHCLYNSSRKTWIPASSIRFAGGYQRGEASAFSMIKSYRLHPYQAADSGFNDRAELDWAVLELAEPIGQSLGYFEIGNLDTEAGTVAGYAGLRPHVLSRTNNCPVRRSADGLLLAICPVMMGDSGAPLLVETPSGIRVVGILSRVAATPQGIAALFVSSESFAVPD